MAAETVKIPSTLYREFQVKKGTVDKENRTVPMSFSSELPVRRMTEDNEPYNEILDHNPSSVKLDRLASGAAPLLMHHDPKDQVGVIKSVKIGDDKRGSCQAQFSRSARGEEVMNDVEDGIRGSTSVGYQVHSMDQDEDEPEDSEGVPNYRCSWEPLEVSLESIPADHTVGANRNQSTTSVSVPIKRKTPKIMITRTRVLAATATEGGGTVITDEDVKARVAEAKKTDKLRVTTILGLSRQFAGKVQNIDKMAREAIDNDKSEDEFTRMLLQGMTNVIPIGIAAATDSSIGMSRKEVEKYSIRKAIFSLSTPDRSGKLDGLEKECHEAALKTMGRNLSGPTGFFIPQDVIQTRFQPAGWGAGRQTRDMQAGIFPLGGALVETEVDGAALIEVLRNKMFVVKAGARTLGGLKANVAIPRQSGTTTAYWLGEIQPTPESDLALQQLLLTPHRLAGNSVYSNLLLIQESVDVEMLIRSDITAQLALAKDLAALSGTGGAQPIGIINTTGVGTMSFTSGTPTLAQIISMESIVAAANADMGELAYMLSTAGRGVLKQTPLLPGAGGVGSAFPAFFWNKPMDSNDAKQGIGEVNGYPAYATNQLNTALNGNKAIFGNWNDLIIADWAGWEVLVDPYTYSKNSEVQVTVSSFTDIGIRHPGSFVYSTNSLV
jgi:HK97 family phage major capsid protein